MSTREERMLAGRQVFAKVIQADVKAAFDDTREQLEPLIDADGGVAAELPDGTRIGTVKRSKPKATAVVTDEAALLEWVKANRPDELVEVVRAAFVDYLKSQAKKYGHAVYGPTGEIVPGIEMQTGAPSFLPQPDPAMVDVVRAKFAELIGHGLLAIERREAS